MKGPTGWFDEEDEILSEINITPLVDVALVLLIIFMITAPMLVQGANVELPRTRPMEALPSEGVFVEIDAGGQTSVNGTAVPKDELEARLERLARAGQQAYLRADRSLSYGTVMQVFDKVRSAGLPNINLVIEPVPEEGSG